MENIDLDTFYDVIDHSKFMVRIRMKQAREIFIESFFEESADIDIEEECRKGCQTIATIAQSLTDEFIGTVKNKILQEALEKLNDTLSVDIKEQLQEINDNLASLAEELGEKNA